MSIAAICSNSNGQVQPIRYALRRLRGISCGFVRALVGGVGDQADAALVEGSIIDEGGKLMAGAVGA
jgi:hypothetical protein